jgi:cysteine dioxygenase
MSDNVESFFAYLDGLNERARLPELLARLREAGIRYEDVAEFVRFSDRGYTRNLVRGSPHYNLLVLCWKNGQRSPIHDHKGSSCAVGVLRGTATETIFEFAPNGHVWATRSLQHRPGSVLASEDTDVHQVSNLQDGGADLVTLHIYSPPLLWMGTYSLTDNIRGQEPMFVEFCDAAGI